MTETQGWFIVVELGIISLIFLLTFLMTRRVP